MVYNTSVRMMYFAPRVTALPSWTRLPMAPPCGKTSTLPTRGATRYAWKDGWKE